MTVAELIARLQTFDPSLRVVTPGFDESNLDDIETVESIKVVFRDYRSGGHCGRHGELGTDIRQPDMRPGDVLADAVLINF